ncbi:MAG: energy-coupling factor transporter transmembrane component T [Actinomycetes bacterium]
MNSLSWWLWSIFLATAAIRSQNNLFGLLLILLLTFVVSKYKNTNNWGNPFKLTLQLALAATLIRLFFAVLIGTPLPGKIIFSLPQLELPNWLAGIRVGGDVTQERMFSVFTESLKFAVVLIAFGAASALSSPIQVIKLISGRIYLFGVSLIISISVLPQIVHSFNRVIAARRMRGLAKFKLSNFRSIITPVLEESIERAIDLSAAMESRGFGYSKKPTRYRPEKFENQDLIIISIAVYLLIFTPILIKTIGVFPALALFAIFASAPLLLFKSKRVHV